MEWRCIHVHYHADQDDLILDAVAPLLRRLRPSVPDAYFVRHWRLGPHLRLVFLTDADRYQQVVRPAVDDVVGGFLARRPSTAALDPLRLLPLHQALADREREEGPLLPWRPDNSVHEAVHDRRIQVLGSEEGADLLADFYVDTTELAFAMLEHVRGGAQRLRLAFALMIATAHACCAGGVGAGFLSFRSHAESYLTKSPEAPQLRPAWDRHAREHLPELAGQVRAVVETLDGTGSVPFVRAWASALARFQRRAGQLIERGALPIPTATRWLEQVKEGGQASDLARLSVFHQTLATSDVFREQVEPTRWFAEYRVMLNYTYLHLSRLGVLPGERLLLCHLAADAVEHAVGVSTMDLIRPAGPAGRGGNVR